MQLFKISANRFSIRSSYIGGLVSFIAQDNIKFDNFAIANWTHRFLWIVLDDGRLMNEYIFLGIVAVNETVATLYIEPLDSSSDFFGCKQQQKYTKENQKK